MLFPDDVTVVVVVVIVGRLWGMRQHAGVRRTPRSCPRPSSHGCPPDGGEHHRGWRSCGSGAVDGWARDPSSGSVRASYTLSSMSSSSSRRPPSPSRQRSQNVVETTVQTITRRRRFHGARVCHSLSVSSPCSHCSNPRVTKTLSGPGGGGGGAVKKNNRSSLLPISPLRPRPPAPRATRGTGGQII